MGVLLTGVLGQGRYPRVAINKESYVIVVYEGVIRRRVYYSIGKAYSNGLRIDWFKNEFFLSKGRYSAVALHNDRVVITYNDAFTYKTYHYSGLLKTDSKSITWAARSEALF